MVGAYPCYGWGLYSTCGIFFFLPQKAANLLGTPAYPVDGVAKEDTQLTKCPCGRIGLGSGGSWKVLVVKGAFGGLGLKESWLRSVGLEVFDASRSIEEEIMMLDRVEATPNRP